MKSCIEAAFQDLKAAAQKVIPVEERRMKASERGPKPASVMA